MTVYEHGIAITDENWKTSLRAIATTELPIYSGFTFTLLDQHGNSLNERAVQVGNVRKAHWAAHYYEESDLRYCVLASLYHLNRIVELYVRVSQLFEEHHPQEPFYGGNTSDNRIGFEVDAFLTSARRCYEALSKVLWKHYGKGNWTSVGKTVESANLPKAFRDVVGQHWLNYGKRLTAYRNCVAHNDPLNRGTIICNVSSLGGKRAVTITLPSNPEAHKRDGYDFDNGPEALSYCHLVACELVNICERADSLDRIRFYLDNPPTERS